MASTWKLLATRLAGRAGLAPIARAGMTALDATNLVTQGSAGARHFQPKAGRDPAPCALTPQGPVPQDQTGSLREALTLLARARAVSSALERRSHKCAGLGLAEAEALLRLAATKGGRYRMSQLAVESGFSQSGLSRIVDRLEGRGLAKRSADHLDRRQILVAATPLGLTVAFALLTSLQEESALLMAPVAGP